MQNKAHCHDVTMGIQEHEVPVKTMQAFRYELLATSHIALIRPQSKCNDIRLSASSDVQISMHTRI